MEYSEENIKLLLFEENGPFRAFVGSLLQPLGYSSTLQPESVEQAISMLKKSPDVSACLIGLNTGDRRESGLKVAAWVREMYPYLPIIFLVKVYTEDVYAICRQYLPSAFLNKELSNFKLRLALEQALLHRSNDESLMQTKQTEHLGTSPSQPIFFKTAEGYITIPESLIYYFHSNQRTTRARTSSSTYETQVQLQTLEVVLQENFVRIHKSYLVNMNYIESIHPNESSLNLAGESLPIGYSFRKHFFSRVKLLR